MSDYKDENNCYLESLKEGSILKVKAFDYMERDHPYFEGVVFLDRVSTESIDVYGYLGVLQTDACDVRYSSLARDPKFGDYLTINEDNLVVSDVIDETYSDYTKYLDLYNQFEDLHNKADYVVSGSIYSEVPKYYDFDTNKAWPYYDVEESKEWRLPNDNNMSLDDVENWLIENHPDYYMGASIHKDCPSGDFSMLAVPSSEYGVGNYETKADRYNYVKSLGESRGLTVCKSEIVGKDNEKQSKWNVFKNISGKNVSDKSYHGMKAIRLFNAENEPVSMLVNEKFIKPAGQNSVGNEKFDIVIPKSINSLKVKYGDEKCNLSVDTLLDMHNDSLNRVSEYVKNNQENVVEIADANVSADTDLGMDK